MHVVKSCFYQKNSYWKPTRDDFHGFFTYVSKNLCLPNTHILSKFAKNEYWGHFQNSLHVRKNFKNYYGSIDIQNPPQIFWKCLLPWGNLFVTWWDLTLNTKLPFLKTDKNCFQVIKNSVKGWKCENFTAYLYTRKL